MNGKIQMDPFLTTAWSTLLNLSYANVWTALYDHVEFRNITAFALY